MYETSLLSYSLYSITIMNICPHSVDKSRLRNNLEKDSSYYLLPEISINLIAIPMLGSIKSVVNPLIRREAESEPIPIFDRRTSTPAC